NLSVQTNYEPHFGERPVGSNAIVERMRDVLRLAVVRQNAFDLLREFMLAIGQEVSRFAGKSIGRALIEQRLLSFEDELLIAQRAHPEPGQYQAWHEYRHHKNQRDLLHGSRHDNRSFARFRPALERSCGCIKIS